MDKLSSESIDNIDVNSTIRRTNKSDKINFLVENSPALIYSFIPKRQCAFLSYGNIVIQNFTGYSLEDLTSGKVCLTTLIHKKDRLKYLSKMRALKRKKSVTIEYRLLHKDKTYHTVIDRLKLIKNDNGKDEVIGCAVDVTERKKINKKLKMLALVADKTSNAVIITDADGFVEWVNDGFNRITGYTLKEMLGKKPGDILQGPDTDPETVKRMHEYIQAKEPFTEEILNYTKEGYPYWLEIHIEPVKNKLGEVEKFIAIESDITQRKLYEEKLIKAREKAENALKAKSDFLSVMSHEIRTPMNAVIGMTNLLLDEIDNSEYQDKLKTLSFSANHLLKLIDDILAFNKIESGKIELEKAPFSIDQLLKGIESSIRPEVNQDKVILEVEKQGNVPSFLVGDQHRLSQILLNLMSNAAKFTEEGYVQLFVKENSVHDDNVTLDFIVTDSGIGIAENRQEQIFESFQQASSDTTRKYGGTGLGLSIVKTLVELMGGEIQLRSEEGKGSTFCFTLKFTKSENLQLDSVDKTIDIDQVLENKTILLVEDNRINQKVAMKFLEKWKINVEVANNGLEALEILKHKSFDCILMDLQMPEMDGFDASRAIRENKDTYPSEIPIIALSASVVSEMKKKAAGIGINSYVTKPFKPNELKQALVKVMNDNGEVRSLESSNKVA